jgi:hypothetical protein
VSEPEHGDEDDRGSGNLAVFVAVAVLVAVAWFLIHEYNANQQMENCRIEGRRDCDPVSVPNQ